MKIPILGSVGWGFLLGATGMWVLMTDQPFWPDRFLVELASGLFATAFIIGMTWMANK